MDDRELHIGSIFLKILSREQGLWFYNSSNRVLPSERESVSNLKFRPDFKIFEEFVQNQKIELIGCS